MMNVLVADGDSAVFDGIKRTLNQRNVGADFCDNGKDCQLSVYSGNFDYVILDAQIKNHGFLEVLRFLKLNHPSIGTILTIPENHTLESYGLTEAMIRKAGIWKILKKPIREEELSSCLSIRKELEVWKELIKGQSSQGAQEVTGEDEDFSRIHITNFLSSDVAIMDYYIQLGSGKYLKFLHKGDSLNEKEVLRYGVEKGIQFLYFKTADRAVYINYMNDLIGTLIDQGTIKPLKMVKSFEDVIGKYLGEIESSGISKPLVDEGLSICQNLYKTVRREPGLNRAIEQMLAERPGEYCLQFMTSFFSVLISKNLDWSTRRTSDFVCLGGLLHRIGFLQLPPGLDDTSLVPSGKAERAEFIRYPKAGADLLANYPLIPEAVRQIVYQHQERNDGSGFPNGLKASQIYPLAKIVGCAQAFSQLLMEEGARPLVVLNEFALDRGNLQRFDAEVLKALILSFMAPEKKNAREQL